MLLKIGLKKFFFCVWKGFFGLLFCLRGIYKSFCRVKFSVCWVIFVGVVLVLCIVVKVWWMVVEILLKIVLLVILIFGCIR